MFWPFCDSDIHESSYLLLIIFYHLIVNTITLFIIIMLLLLLLLGIQRLCVIHCNNIVKRYFVTTQLPLPPLQNTDHADKQRRRFSRERECSLYTFIAFLPFTFCRGERQQAVAHARGRPPRHINDRAARRCRIFLTKLNALSSSSSTLATSTHTQHKPYSNDTARRIYIAWLNK